MKKHAGKDHREVYPDKQQQWELERKNLKELLQKHGAEVLEPRNLKPEEKQLHPNNGYANFFCRDPFFVIGDYVIEASMRFLHRRHEVWPLRDLLWSLTLDTPCTYLAALFPEISSIDDLTLGIGPFIEGGDVLVLDKHILVGNSGFASNDLGIKWLRKLLSPKGYTVESVRLHPDILHLDCALGLVRGNLMVVCKEALLDGIPTILKTWKSIEVTLEEAGQLATNGLPISSDLYLTDPEFEHIGAQIEKEGVKVEYVDFQISRSFGGAFRCTTQALRRED